MTLPETPTKEILSILGQRVYESMGNGMLHSAIHAYRKLQNLIDERPLPFDSWKDAAEVYEFIKKESR